MSRNGKLLLLALVLAAAPAIAQPPHTVLTFGGLANGPVDQTYGDNVTAATMGSFTYGGSGTFTPDVTVSYSQDLPGDPQFSVLGFSARPYSGLTGVLHSGGSWDITLTGLPGVNVTLRGFDMGSSVGAPIIPGLVVTDATNSSVLFSQSNVALGFFNQPHVSFDFSPGLVAQAIKIRFDMTGLPFNVADFVGVDHVDFSQGANNVAAQANRPSSSLQLNGAGALGVSGPHVVSLGGSSTLTLDWTGPAGQPLVLMTGPMHPTGTNFGSCVGTMHLGDPTILFSDVTFLFNGLEPTFPGSVFVLDPAGSAQQSFTLPAGLAGTSSMQGIVFQGPGAPCALALTAAFAVNWQ